MKTRIIESKINLSKNISTGKNKLLKDILRKTKADKKNRWTITLDKYLEEINITSIETEKLNKKEIKDRLRRWDSENWRKEIESKSSLNIYRYWKKEIKEETFYDNRWSSKLLFLARTNSLPLNIRNRHTNGKVHCNICDMNVNEDLEHFLIDCPRLENERCQKYIEEKDVKDDAIGKFLFEVSNIEEKKEMIQKMWKKRKSLIQEMDDL